MLSFPGVLACFEKSRGLSLPNDFNSQVVHVLPHSAGMRLVKDTEITLAIVDASIAQYCNPCSRLTQPVSSIVQADVASQAPVVDVKPFKSALKPALAPVMTEKDPLPVVSARPAQPTLAQFVSIPTTPAAPGITAKPKATTAIKSEFIDIPSTNVVKPPEPPKPALPIVTATREPLIARETEPIVAPVSPPKTPLRTPSVPKLEPQISDEPVDIKHAPMQTAAPPVEHSKPVEPIQRDQDEYEIHMNHLQLF
jgi:hypothetical protein